MPAPQADMLTMLTKLAFIGKSVTLPPNFKEPSKMYKKAFSPQDLRVPPNPALTLFKSATLNKLHVKTSKEKSDEISAFIEKISKAICSAIDMWMKQATISGVLVNGPVGIMVPGSVKGPNITSFINSKGPRGTPLESKYTDAIAKAIGNGWQAWSAGMAGVFTYPPFAAVPSPVAPPTPNVPMPAMFYPSPGEAQLVPPVLAKTMMMHFKDTKAAHAKTLFESVSYSFYVVFTMFKLQTMVQNVLGTGPVPIFAPPIVPVGPVLAGVGTGAPGCFA